MIKDLKLLTGPALFLVSWLMFGVYEIGYAIEDPFQGTLRLSIICDIIRRDVLGDEIIRSTAFDLRADAEKDEGEEGYHDGKDQENGMIDDSDTAILASAPLQVSDVEGSRTSKTSKRDDDEEEAFG